MRKKLPFFIVQNKVAQKNNLRYHLRYENKKSAHKSTPYQSPCKRRWRKRVADGVQNVPDGRESGISVGRQCLVQAHP